MEVNNRSLIKIGHFLLTKEYCARDWIDTLEVVETKVILNKIVNAIVKHINNSGYDDYIIAGVDLVGTLLASRIAFTLQAPLTYIVPEKEKNVNAHQEIDLEIEKDKKVILITDAIVTFNTVKSAIEKNKLENSVICIYTMFYRESDYQGCAEYVDKTFSINNAFRIELFRKEKCTYNKTKCIASNRRLREDCCFSSRQILADWCGNDLVYYVVVWNKLYSRKCWENIRFPVGKIHEDNFVMYKLFFTCNRIVCSKTKKYNYVQRNNSIMSAKISSKRFNSVEAFCETFRFYQENGLSDINCDVVKRLGQHFFDLNGRINLFICTNEERQYIKNTKKRFYDVYFVEARQNSIKNFIKYYFPNLLRAIRKIVRYSKFTVTLLKYCLMFEKKAVLIDTPTHGNLGDHAIVLTQKQLLVKNKVSTHELSASAIDYKEYLFAKLTPKNKCIIIRGGGFLGTLWPNEEERVRRIINCFKDNKIIIFPQTVSYDLTSESGRKYLKQAQKIYSAHSNLTFFVREKQSYEIMQKYFPSVETVLVPDIVTLLDMDIAGQNRKDILFCMRSDLEKNVTDEQLAEIQQILKIHYPNEQMNKIDTVVPYMVSEGMRKKEVKNKLEQFKKAKLIITDRLHGMIFATITATPCIAFGNSNGKVKNVYGWLKHNEYIKYVNDIDEFKSIVETLDIERKYYYDKTILYDDFEPLLNIIKEIN